MLAKSTMLTLKKKNLSLIWSGFHTENFIYRIIMYSI